MGRAHNDVIMRSGPAMHKQTLLDRDYRNSSVALHCTHTTPIFTQNGLIKACERGLKEVVSLAIVTPGATCDVNSTDEVCIV